MKIPKYYQVKREILALIDGAAPGTAVPAERDLAERFATSRTTVRQAIAELVLDGRLERTQGSGTFVARPKLMPVRPLTSFSHDVSSDGWRPGSVVLDVRVEPAAGQACERLRVRQGDPIMRIERIRTAADEHIAHEIAHLPRELPDLADELERHGSLYRALEASYGIAIDTVEDIIETAPADPREADLLGVETGLPMLLIHRTAWDRDGTPVEWTRSVFRGDRFRFIASHRFEPSPAGPATPDPTAGPTAGSA